MIQTRSLRLVGAGLALCLTATVAGAQTPEAPVAPVHDIEKDAAILRERKRQVLHPGQPLELVGNEQQGNDFRAHVPGLASVERRSTTVDADENYARRLTMFNRGSRYTTPVAAPHPSASGSRARPGQPGSDGATPRTLDRPLDSPAPGGFHPVWWILAGAAMLWTAVRALRGRSAAGMAST